jgi:outer membrane protein OmpA-like peptidoglycan-associated protein
MGVQAGPMLYFGDLSDQLKTIALARAGVSLYGQYHLNDHLALRVGILQGSVQGDDRMGNLSGPNPGRGLSFRSSITEASVTGRIYFLDGRRQIRPYFLVGLGVFRFNPKADLFLGSGEEITNRYVFQANGNLGDTRGNQIDKDGIYETTLWDWKTEGFDNSFIRYPSKYSRIQATIPWGLGTKISLSPYWDISFECGIRYLFTDYLDDVSSRYASPELVQENFPGDAAKQALATYISNPSGATSAFRGNETSKDVYAFTSMGLEYRFGKIHLPKTYIWQPYRPDFLDEWAFGFGPGMLLMHGDMRDHLLAPSLRNRARPNRADIQAGGSVYVTRHLSPYFALKGEVLAGSLAATRQPEFASTPVFDVSLNLILDLTNTFPRYKPYARKVNVHSQAGMGRTSVIGSVRRIQDGVTVRYTGPSNYTVLPVGGGMRIHLNPHIDLDLNYTYRMVNSDFLDATRSGSDRPLLNTVKDGYSWLNISIAWVILKPAEPKEKDPFKGLKKKVFQELQTDQDQDGIPDFRDQDPYTLPGIPVNAAGVALDRDKDGVADLYDEDPFTPPGLKVNTRGMPSDQDKDGVPDYRDLEPDSPPGTLVNFKGQSFFDPDNEASEALALEALKPMLSTWNFLMIYFDFDKAIVKNEYYESLSQLALLLEKIPELEIKLIGHADIRGNKDYNLKLSERRAGAVVNILSETYGISPERCMIQAQGKESPHTRYVSQEAQGSNRRVEIRLMYKGKEITQP